MTFALKYIGIVLVLIVTINISGWFLGRGIDAMLPDDGIDVYPSREAAIATAYRGDRIADQIEIALIVVSSAVVFVLMRRRQKSSTGDGQGPNAND